MISFFLITIFGGANFELALYLARAALLDNMGQFMGQQFTPISTLRIIGILLKEDVAARCEGARLHGAIEGISFAASMDTDIREITSKAFFHLALHFFAQGTTAPARTGDAALDLGAYGATLKADRVARCFARAIRLATA